MSLNINITQVENGYVVYDVGSSAMDYTYRRQWVANTREELARLVDLLAQQADMPIEKPEKT